MAARCPGAARLGRRAWEAFAYLPTDTTEGVPDALVPGGDRPGGAGGPAPGRLRGRPDAVAPGPRPL